MLSDTKLQLADAKRIADILSDAETALELLDADKADDADSEMLLEACTSVQKLETALDAWELERLLDMPYASNGAVLTITAGAGGTDAQARLLARSAHAPSQLTATRLPLQDWAEMLSRMYERWATAEGFSSKVRVPRRPPAE